MRMLRLTGRRLLSLCLALCLHGVTAGVHAQQVSDADVKAALVYNFMVFVEWPDEGQARRAPLTICVAAASELQTSFQALRDKKVRGLPIVIQGLHASDDMATCRVLYIDQHLRAQWPLIRKKLAGSSLLTIADPAISRIEGAVIDLVTADNKIGFEVDSIAARDANLLVSSKLLRLARKVH